MNQDKNQDLEESVEANQEHQRDKPKNHSEPTLSREQPTSQPNMN